MSEEEGGERSNSVKGTIEAATGLVKAIPIYDDMLQPAAKQLGKTLETVCKAVNVALAPVSGLVWGYEQFQAFIDTKVASRLKDIPAEDIITPKPNVAGPAIEALRYTGHEDSLSDLYANLLASAMDRSTAKEAHPAFVEIIKQLTPDEARILNLFVSQSIYPLISLRAEKTTEDGGADVFIHYSHLSKTSGVLDADRVPAYLDNFCRLGIMEVPPNTRLTAKGVYDEIENDPVILEQLTNIALDPNRKPRVIRLMIRTTRLGDQFIDACVRQKAAQK